jgi:predicted 2-oxoglutarate/Fe(II)-dependent dioxygenase YbiX
MKIGHTAIAEMRLEKGQTLPMRAAILPVAERFQMTVQNGKRVALGDPVPWFRAANVDGGKTDICVSAGRWIVLAFLGSLGEAQAQTRLATLVKQAALFSEDHLIIYAVLSAPPDDAARILAMSSPVLKFIADYDGAIGAFYGADEKPLTIALDPMLRAIANISGDHTDGHDAVLERLLRDLPSVDNSAGVPLTAPVLIVPRVFDFPLCDLLVSIYDKVGGTDSGFLVARDGKPATATDHSKKRRQDMVIAPPELRRRIRERIVKRLLPAIELYFQFKATRMDRYLVACYDSAIGGHFFRHRDNLNPGVEHRRFAVSLNLNGGYEGCDLIFPEFGRRTYRAPVGGAIVFSCGALHEVTPITRGRRYAFLSFLYGEADAKKGLENNSLLHEIEKNYQADEDRLYPENAA